MLISLKESAHSQSYERARGREELDTLFVFALTETSSNPWNKPSQGFSGLNL